jgi:heat-inducible transcriptional repressor
MLPERRGKILKSIVERYIDQAVPVPSQSIASSYSPTISSATVRNEVASLRQEGYIIQPHTSAGSMPSDKGYRYYVEAMDNAELPAAEQHLVSHLFHQVEAEIEQWLSLAASLLARQVMNVAVVSTPKQDFCRFKHMELLSLHDTQVLLVLMLHGTKVKQKLIHFEQAVSQGTLTVISARLNAELSGLTCEQIGNRQLTLSAEEQLVLNSLVETLQEEDRLEYGEPYLDGLHHMMNQPEFASSNRLRSLMELVEQHALLKAILPEKLGAQGVHVVIGKENREEAIHDYSVVISHYGTPGQAVGRIGVVGPTRMAYSRTIPFVDYLATVLSSMISGLYGEERTGK